MELTVSIDAQQDFWRISLEIEKLAA